MEGGHKTRSENLGERFFGRPKGGSNPLPIGWGAVNPGNLLRRELGTNRFLPCLVDPFDIDAKGMPGRKRETDRQRLGVTAGNAPPALSAGVHNRLFKDAFQNFDTLSIGLRERLSQSELPGISSE